MQQADCLPAPLPSACSIEELHGQAIWSCAFNRTCPGYSHLLTTVGGRQVGALVRHAILPTGMQDGSCRMDNHAAICCQGWHGMVLL